MPFAKLVSPRSYYVLVKVSMPNCPGTLYGLMYMPFDSHGSEKHWCLSNREGVVQKKNHQPNSHVFFTRALSVFSLQADRAKASERYFEKY